MFYSGLPFRGPKYYPMHTISITTLHHGEILNKEDYSQENLHEGDRVSFFLHAGCY
jgi:hypothetical protein